MLNFLSILNVTVAVALVTGGFIAFRLGLMRTTEEIQERVIHALQSEMQVLRDRVAALERENTRLSQVIMVIKSALKQRGLSVTIDGELVSIYDSQGNITQTSRIYGVSGHEKMEEV